MGIPIFKSSKAVTAATAGGVLTVDETASLFPGTFAWLELNDGTKQDHVKILSILSATTLQVGPAGPQKGPTGFYYQSYGALDASGYNGNAAKIYIETQVAPVDPAYTRRTGV